MNCPNCGGFELEIVESRYIKSFGGAKKRRRDCKKCYKRFSTYEVTEKVIKNLLKPRDNHERIVRQQTEATRDFLSKLEAIIQQSGESSDDISADPDNGWNDI